MRLMPAAERDLPMSLGPTALPRLTVALSTRHYRMVTRALRGSCGPLPVLRLILVR
jgi:hypothetical protein